MIPGNDNKHFCRPSSVVTTLDGSVFVADGICNNRVVQLSANGRFIHSFGTKVSKTFNGKRYTYLPIYVHLIDKFSQSTIGSLRDDKQYIC